MGIQEIRRPRRNLRQATNHAYIVQTFEYIFFLIFMIH